jgi:hypothetical protein
VSLPRALLLVLAATLAWAQDSFPPAARIVAIGDLHGGYTQFVTLLRQAGLVDARLRWTGGQAVLVQTGDCLDRGPESRKILDLLIKLEKDAARAGGRVHALLGNHEAMNIYGDLRYVAPEEYGAFKTSQSAEFRDAFYQQELEARAKQDPTRRGDPGADYRAKWYEEHPLGWLEHRVAFSPEGQYGKWLTAHNAMVRVGDTLFLHGGIGPKYAAARMTDLNETIRRELTTLQGIEQSVAADPDGPLWYRGLAQGDEAELAAHLAAVLAQYGVKRIVIGHTPTLGAVMPRFNQQVIVIDVGLGPTYGNRQAFLALEAGTPYAVHRGKKLALPANGAGMLEYLRQAAALDPQPSTLTPLIDQLKTEPRP